MDEEINLEINNSINELVSEWVQSVCQTMTKPNLWSWQKKVGLNWNIEEEKIYTIYVQEVVTNFIS